MHSVNVTQLQIYFDDGARSIGKNFNALDRNCLGGGLMLFLREDILSNLITIEEK